MRRIKQKITALIGCLAEVLCLPCQAGHASKGLLLPGEKRMMQYNTCRTCGASDGRSGMLINYECLNCHDTRKTGNICVHSNLCRSSEELKITFSILDEEPEIQERINTAEAQAQEKRMGKDIKKSAWEAAQEELLQENAKLREGIKAVRALINESAGVSGLHLNGDLAPWDEIEAGGRFEEWLIAFNDAESYLN